MAIKRSNDELLAIAKAGATGGKKKRGKKTKASSYECSELRHALAVVRRTQKMISDFGIRVNTQHVTERPKKKASKKKASKKASKKKATKKKSRPNPFV